MGSKMKDWYTIPNILSYIRIVLIPCFILSYRQAGRYGKAGDYTVPALIIVVSGITDVLDGIIARKFNQITELGKVLDPIADKLTQFTILITLMAHYRYMWILTVLFVVKELFMGISGLVLIHRKSQVNGAKWFGKLSTAVFYSCMILLIAFPAMDPLMIEMLSLLICVVLGFSFALYISTFIHELR